MRKIFNKLFEWLGYKLLSDEEYDELDKTFSRVLRLAQEGISEALKQKRGWFSIAKTEQGYEVRFYFTIVDFIVIKFFPFGDDKEYAKLCAEELCEKLNERI